MEDYNKHLNYKGQGENTFENTKASASCWEDNFPS
jgi:hypothetical protein